MVTPISFLEGHVALTAVVRRLGAKFADFSANVTRIR